MKGLLPSFVTYFCAGFMLAIPLALAMVFINPVFGLLLVGVYYSWCFFLWDHLRLLRQRELGSALRLALASGLPIDRVLAPEIPVKTVWSWCERAIQWVVPFPFFRPIWDMRYGYLALRKRAADLYLAGQGEEALALPGLLCRDDLFDIRVGQASPDRSDLKEREDLDLVPRLMTLVPGLFYPLLVLILVVVITLLWSVFVAPKIARIFLEFNLPLPALTQWVLAWANSVLAGILPILLVTGAILMAAYYESPLRWWLPGLKGIFGTHGRGLILSALGHLVNRAMPLDKAIAWLLTSKAADGTGTRRLNRLARFLDSGMDASKALYQSRLVRQSEAAWLATTPASGRFGHALVELGQSLQAIALRRLELRTILATTLGTVVVGLVVATTVLAIFTPLIELISWITP